MLRSLRRQCSMIFGTLGVSMKPVVRDHPRTYRPRARSRCAHALHAGRILCLMVRMMCARQTAVVLELCSAPWARTWDRRQEHRLPGTRGGGLASSCAPAIRDRLRSWGCRGGLGAAHPGHDHQADHCRHTSGSHRLRESQHIGNQERLLDQQQAAPSTGQPSTRPSSSRPDHEERHHAVEDLVAVTDRP